MPLDSEGRGELRPPFDRENRKGVGSSRRFAFGCIIPILLLAGLAGWSGLQGWYYFNGRDEIYLDGSYEDMLASLPLYDRKLLESNDNFREQWQDFKQQKASKALMRRWILEETSLMPDVLDLAVMEELKYPDPRLHIGNDPGWTELWPPQPGQKGLRYSVPCQLDEDPAEELLLGADGVFALELDGSLRELEGLEELNIFSASAWNMDGVGPSELLVFPEYGEDGYEGTARIVDADGVEMLDSGLIFGGSLHHFADYNGDGAIDIFAYSRNPEGRKSLRHFIFAGDEGVEIIEVTDCPVHIFQSTDGDLDGNGSDELIGFPVQDGVWGNLAMSYEYARGALELPMLPARSEGGEPVWAGDINGDGTDEVLYDFLNVLVDADSGERTYLEMPAGEEYIWFSRIADTSVQLLQAAGQRWLVTAVKTKGGAGACYLAVWDAEGGLRHWESIGDAIQNLYAPMDDNGQRIVLELSDSIQISSPGWLPGQ